MTFYFNDVTYFNVCGFFGGFLVLFCVLREVAAPLLEKIPCQFQFFKSFFFVSLCEFVEYVDWVCSVSNVFQLGFCQLGLDVVALLGWCVLVYWGLIVHSRSEVRGKRKPNKKYYFVLPHLSVPLQICNNTDTNSIILAHMQHMMGAVLCVWCEICAKYLVFGTYPTSTMAALTRAFIWSCTNNCVYWH